MSQLEDEALAVCNREPIQVPGSIQGFGALLAVDDRVTRLTHVSDNLGEYLGVAANAPADAQLLDVLPGRVVHELRSVGGLKSLGRFRHRLQATLEGPRGALEIDVHRSQRRFVVELEPGSTDLGRMASSDARALLGRLQSRSSFTHLLTATATGLRTLTGFDRVLVYRFLPEHDGEVVAESASTELESFLGLRFPASDIPPQARELYLRLPLRLIADVGAAPRAVRVVAEGESQPLDLSLAQLRGVSPVHLEYLRNMGVASSMSLPIVVEGMLWGLVALHHRTPRLLPAASRSALEVFGQVLSLLIEQATREAAREARTRAKEFPWGGADTPLAERVLEVSEGLQALIPHDGLAVQDGDRFLRVGSGLDVPELSALFAGDPEGSGLPWTHSSHESLVAAVGRVPASLAGALVIPAAHLRAFRVALFRNELVETLRWGGSPLKEIEVGPSGPRLRPRASFAAYVTHHAGACSTWTAHELAAAETLQQRLLEELSRREAVEAERQKTLLVAELSHRFRNILTMIRSLVRHSHRSADSVDDFAQRLDQRVAALIKAHELALSAWSSGARLSDLLETELAASATEAGPGELHGPDVVLSPKHSPTVALVLHELTTNAMKHGALRTPGGRVDVRWSWTKDGLELVWRERGGPPAPVPTRRGFGLSLIERAVRDELRGQCELEFSPMGLSARLELPHRVFLSPPEALGPASSPPTEPALTGPVLLVEDNALAALDAEEMCRELGFGPVHVAGDLGSALEIARSAELRVALLDVQLGDETTYPVALALEERAVPCLFLTGYGASEIPERHARHPVLTKPVDREGLCRALVRLLGTTHG